MFFNAIVWLAQCPTILPTYFNQYHVFMYKSVSIHWVLPSRNPAGEVPQLDNGAFPDWIKLDIVVEASHSFKNNVAVTTKSIDTEADVVFLSAICLQTCKFSITSRALKIWHDHAFKATRLVLSRFYSTGFRIHNLTHNSSRCHWLSFEHGYSWLASISTTID